MFLGMPMTVLASESEGRGNILCLVTFSVGVGPSATGVLLLLDVSCRPPGRGEAGREMRLIVRKDESERCYSSRRGEEDLPVIWL